jgi:hypothetical protein
MRGQDDERLSGKNPTSGGSSEMEVNEPTTRPVRKPASSTAVTTHTPVGYAPNTARNCFGSIIGYSSFASIADPGHFLKHSIRPFRPADQQIWQPGIGIVIGQSGSYASWLLTRLLA